MRSMDAEGCARLLDQAESVVAFSGAGISTAAGIADFRGPGGIYETGAYDPVATFDIRAFRQDPRPFFRFTRDLMRRVDDIQPTFTHRFLARLEEEGRLTGVITQNIDPLHQMAGSRNVISVHGSYATSSCMVCGRRYDLDGFRELLARMEIPRCDCERGGVVKPDVVFFGEEVTGLAEAAELAASSDLMLVLGSSLEVYPAAGLPELAAGDVVIVNAQPVRLRTAGAVYFARDTLDRFFRQVDACRARA